MNDSGVASICVTRKVQIGGLMALQWVLAQRSGEVERSRQTLDWLSVAERWNEVVDRGGMLRD
jgi:hypothetical protein